MRGSDERTGSLFSYVGVEGRLRPDHPLRAIRMLTDETLAAMERELAALYSGMRRPMRRGTDRVGWAFTFAAAAYNLVRLPKLLVTAT